MFNFGPSPDILQKYLSQMNNGGGGMPPGMGTPNPGGGGQGMMGGLPSFTEAGPIDVGSTVGPRMPQIGPQNPLGGGMMGPQMGQPPMLPPRQPPINPGMSGPIGPSGGAPPSMMQKFGSMSASLGPQAGQALLNQDRPKPYQRRQYR